MLIQLTNTPRNYEWGAHDGIAMFSGRQPSGLPEAELWFGTHPGSPTAVIRTFPATTQTHSTLADFLRAQPDLLSDTDNRDLPILLKVLAAAKPLSLQVHPTPQQARAGFAAENARGIPLDAANRNYKDPWAKPEIIVAISEFDALCGFRPSAEVAELIAELRSLGGLEAEPLEPLLRLLADAENIEAALRWLLSGDTHVSETVSALLKIANSGQARSGPRAADFSTMRDVAQHHPDDPGVVIALLMNRIHLSPGECLFAPAGMIHAYLRGVGIELMSASDNVVRGGLTDKHVDVEELISLLDFTQQPAQLCVPSTVEDGVHMYAPSAPFVLTRIDSQPAGCTLRSSGPSLVLVEEGTCDIEGAVAGGKFNKGDAIFVSAHEFPLQVRGRGRIWVATVEV